MSAQVLEFAGYRASRVAPRRAAPGRSAVVLAMPVGLALGSPSAAPVALQPANVGAAAALDALDTMRAACAAWTQSLDRVAANARAVARHADVLRAQSAAVQAMARSVTGDCATLAAEPAANDATA